MQPHSFYIFDAAEWFLPKLKREKLFEADMVSSLDSKLQALFFSLGKNQMRDFL